LNNEKAEAPTLLLIDKCKKEEPKIEDIVTQTEIIEFNLMKMERARLFRDMKKWRTDVQTRLSRGANVEPGPHSAEAIQKTILAVR